MFNLGAHLHWPIIRRMGRQLAAAQTPAEVRTIFNQWARILTPALGVAASRTSLADVPAMHLLPKRAIGKRTLLYLHGGGYCFGTPSGYRPLVSRIARGTGAAAYLLDYRLAPEHPFPAAIDDALAAYQTLVEKAEPRSLTVVGDSAGGGLTLALLHRVRDAGLPLPACAAILSPWLDLTHSGETITTCAATELLVPEVFLVRLAEWYAAGHELADPRISPLFGQHQGLPPLLVQASTTEALHSDAERFAAAAQQAGVEVTFEAYENIWHAWHLMTPLVTASRAAVRSACNFLSEHLEQS